MIIKLKDSEKENLAIASSTRQVIEKNIDQMLINLKVAQYQVELLRQDINRQMGVLGEKYKFNPSVDEIKLNFELGIIEIQDLGEEKQDDKN